jgi:ribosomal-protein-alanine N-acetyltransferase
MPLRVRVRWAILSDHGPMAAIDRKTIGGGWTAADFHDALRNRDIVGKVAEADGRVVGLMVYDLPPARNASRRVKIMRLAVAPPCRRLRVGTQLVGDLIRSRSKGDTIWHAARETNLAAHLFFRSQGFRGVNVLRGHFEDTGEDAFLFRYKVA